MEVEIPSRAIRGCLSVYCIADIVWGCGSVAAVPREDSRLPQRLVVRRGGTWGGGREGVKGGRERRFILREGGEGKP